jgi:hypothetical protein
MIQRNGVNRRTNHTQLPNKSNPSRHPFLFLILKTINIGPLHPPRLESFRDAIPKQSRRVMLRDSVQQRFNDRRARCGTTIDKTLFVMRQDIKQLCFRSLLMKIHHLVTTFLVLTTFCLACVAGYRQPESTAKGRLIENWPYERLFENAELVVLARAVSNVDSPDRTKDNPWEIEFRGVNTTFEVSSKLKGNTGPTITVRHFKLPPAVLVANGPLHSEFRTKRVEVELKHVNVSLAKPEYMLFLKSCDDGKFELIAGHTDSELAVRELHHGTSSFLNSSK